MNLSIKLLYCVFLTLIFVEVFAIFKENKTKPTDIKVHIFDVTSIVQKPIEKKEPSNYEEALEIAKQQDKKVLLIFSATWCGYCRQMEATTFKDEEVKKEMSKYVVYKVDIDRERNIASKYGSRGVPNYCIVNYVEKVEKKSVGYMSSQKFISWLKS